MPIGSFIAIYLVVWWLCIFIMLPLGVRNQVETGEAHAAGTDPGAPARPLLLAKIVATTVLSAIITPLLLWGLSSPFLRQYWS